MLTLLYVQRSRNNTVTVPILIPCDEHERQGTATFLVPEPRTPQPVRTFTSEDLRVALRKMWKYEREHFLSILALRRGAQENDTLAVKHASERLTDALKLKHHYDARAGITESDIDFLPFLVRHYGLSPGQEKEALDRFTGYYGIGGGAQADTKRMLSQQMSQALGSVRLVLWWSGTRFRPALYCSDIKSAPYAFALMQKVGVCPHCGQLFTPRRPDQNYCSIPHREAHRVARWRAVKRQKSRKRGGPNGSRKTR